MYLYTSVGVSNENIIVTSNHPVHPLIISTHTFQTHTHTHTQDKLAPNIMAMVRSFNQVALLIPSEILEEKTPQSRAKIITTYIQVGVPYIMHGHPVILCVCFVESS